MVWSKLKVETAAQQISFVLITNRAAARQILFGTNTMELYMQHAKKMIMSLKMEKLTSKKALGSTKRNFY
jgi:hypothetical protein